MWRTITSQFQKEICPYCFEYFHIKDTPFRCSSPPSLCAPKPDKIYQSAWADSRPLGKVLEPTGKFKDRFKQSLNCGSCGHQSR
jgi:hypothetical protein